MASDVQISPEDIAGLCARYGVEVWGFNCEGCRAGQAAADWLGLVLVPGVEMSAYLERSTHVLG